MHGRVFVCGRHAPGCECVDKLNSAKLIAVRENYFARHQHDTEKTQSRAKLYP